MSQSAKHSSREIEDASEEAEEDVSEIASQLKRTSRHAGQGRILPSLLGWKVSCPHCGEQFMVTYQDDGSFELKVED